MSEIAPNAPNKIFVGIGKFIRNQAPAEISRRIMETYDEKIAPKLHGKAAEIAQRLRPGFSAYAKVAGVTQTALEVELAATALMGATMIGKKAYEMMKTAKETKMDWLERSEIREFGHEFKSEICNGRTFRLNQKVHNGAVLGNGRVRVLADEKNQQMLIIAQQKIQNSKVYIDGETRVLLIDKKAKTVDLAILNSNKILPSFIRSSDSVTSTFINWETVMSDLDHGNPFANFSSLAHQRRTGDTHKIMPQLTEILRNGKSVPVLEQRLANLGKTNGNLFLMY